MTNEHDLRPAMRPVLQELRLFVTQQVGQEAWRVQWLVECQVRIPLWVVVLPMQHVLRDELVFL